MHVLPVIRELLEALHSSGVSYCHWKSNVHLGRSLLGQADLDLLIDPDDQEGFEALLRELRFVRLIHTGPKRIPGLEDFLGFDDTTGALVHAHVHYRLVLGEQRVKNHHLPIERWLLANATVRDGVRVPRPQDELFLLYVRSIVKSDVQACARAWLRRARHPFPATIHAELLWLAGQTSRDEVLAACDASGLGTLAPGLADFLERLRHGRLTPGYVLAHKGALLRRLRPYRRYSSLRCGARKAWFRVRYSRPARMIFPLPKKRLASAGVLAAVTGADGCGKTSLARDLSRWLAWKLEATTVYFGQPKRSVVLTGFRRARQIVGAASRRVDRSGTRPLARVLAWCAGVVNGALWLYMARYRLAADAQCRHLIHRGHVVFAERFPLRDFWDMEAPMDGPRLRREADGRGLLRWIAAREQAVYDRMGAPDGLILLNASLATLRARKPETPPDEHRAKAGAVAMVAERMRRDVIDAEQPYEDVVLEAKRRVWRLLSPGSGRGAAGASRPLAPPVACTRSA